MTQAECVLYDPKRIYEACALVEEEQARLLRIRGCATIPVCPELLSINGAAGFVFKQWGKGALPPPTPARMATPLVLYRHAGYADLNWRARLVPEPYADEADPVGELRVIGDTAQLHVAALGLPPDGTHAVIAKLGSPQNGGWNVGGKVRVHPGEAGYQGLALYGWGRGYRVTFLAVSQTGRALPP